MKDKKYDNGLNQWFSIFLYMNIIGGVISFIVAFIKAFLGYYSSMPLVLYLDLTTYALFVYGCIKLLYASRVGLYIVVAVIVINIALAEIMSGLFCSAETPKLIASFLQESASKAVFINTTKLVLMFLLMFLRYKGKNAYQVLWEK